MVGLNFLNLLQRTFKVKRSLKELKGKTLAFNETSFVNFQTFLAIDGEGLNNLRAFSVSCGMFAACIFSNRTFFSSEENLKKQIWVRFVSTYNLNSWNSWNFRRRKLLMKFYWEWKFSKLFQIKSENAREDSLYFSGGMIRKTSINCLHNFSSHSCVSKGVVIDRLFCKVNALLKTWLPFESFPPESFTRRAKHTTFTLDLAPPKSRCSNYFWRSIFSLITFRTSISLPDMPD